MELLKNKKGSLALMEETNSQLERKVQEESQQIIFTSSRKIKIVFNKAEYKMNNQE